MQELSGVSEAARDLAMSRFRVIQPYLEQKRSLESVAVDAELSFRTVQRWVSSYRKFGLVALVRESRDDRGGRRVVSTKIKAAIEGPALETLFAGQIHLSTGSTVCGGDGRALATLRNGL
jgi:putative transposase